MILQRFLLLVGLLSLLPPAMAQRSKTIRPKPASPKASPPPVPRSAPKAPPVPAPQGPTASARRRTVLPPVLVNPAGGAFLASGKLYHLSSCPRGPGRIAPTARRYRNETEARRAGLSPCPDCIKR